jgi:hypothetical protein
VPPLGYYALMAWNAPAIGVRYVLPVLHFLFVAAGCGASVLLRHARARWLLVPLAAAAALGFTNALQTSPLAFFNGLFCSTGQVPPCLDDSNVDWSQALPALGSYRDRRFPGSALRIFHVGLSPPQAYLQNVTPADPMELAHPQRALYAVSLHLITRMPERSWPRQLAPLSTAGGAYAIYDLRDVP